MPLSLADLVRRARLGDEGATVAMIEHFESVVRPYALRGDADEIRQEAASCLVEELTTIPDEPNAKGLDLEDFLRARLNSRLTQYLRAERRRRAGQVSLSQAALERLADRTPTDLSTPSPRLRSALRQLSPAQRSVLYRLYWQEKKAIDIAREDGTTREAVQAIRRRATTDLSRALRNQRPTR
jgi:RNA polymerase sigma factor (sigma-70 family)